jgi:2-succinyl-6-hydroxy-2,4-cyclohexadiene-1-carboxylate synthase
VTPLMLVHGFTGSPPSWRHVLAACPHARVALAPSLLGHAGGPDGSSAGGFEEEVERLAGLAETTGAGRLHLIGYSLGARLGLALLLRRPDLFAAATLIAPHPGLTTDAERQQRARDDEAWCQLLETRGIDTFADAWQAQPLFATQAQLPPERLDEQRRLRLSHDPSGLAASLRLLGLAGMPCYLPLAHRVPVAVKLVVGQADHKFAALARDLARRLPQANLSILPDAGHNPVLECPERVARLLEQGASA